MGLLLQRIACLLIVCMCCCITGYCKSEKLIDNDSLLTAYLIHQPSGIDTNTDAVSLLKRIRIGILPSPIHPSVELFTYSEEYCYKVLTPAGLGLAALTIPSSDNLKAKKVNIYVCYMEGGKLVKEKITKSDAIKETIVKGVKVYKFNLPELQVGRILYYTYTYELLRQTFPYTKYITMPFSFEGKYPCLASVLEFETALTKDYKAFVKNIKFDTIATEAAINREGNTVSVQKTDKTITTIWHASNVPQTEEEAFVRNPADKQAGIKLLINNGTAERPNDLLLSTWAYGAHKYFYNLFPPDTLDISKQTVLKKIPVLERVDSFRLSPPPTLADSLEYIRQVYYFVRDSIKTVRNNASYSFQNYGLPRLEDREGTAIQKNALLTRLYQRMGLTSRNVIL